MRKIHSRENITSEANMTRTNFCPVLNNAETDSPIISRNNPRKYNSTFHVESLDDNYATVHVFIKNKTGDKVATVRVTYDTRDGFIQKDIIVQLEGDEFIDISDWAKELKLIGQYLKALIHKFAELNDSEFMWAQVRPKLVATAADDNKVKRTYTYHVESFERKGFYRNTKLGKCVYVRPATIVIGE